uniref:non-specific serine/threonine protein kinase n=1 Tax=Oryza barthii TaxID=65489 RepID=A0A0D3EJD1_9ORYZ
MATAAARRRSPGASIRLLWMACQLLPAMIVAASLLHVATATGNVISSNNNTSCTPARCGNLTISYPFSLSGVQPVSCGYPVLDLTCDNRTGRAYLSRTFRDHLYRVESIFYENNSLVAAVETTFAGDADCPVPDFNVTSSLSPYPFIISNTNKYLAFIYNCSIPEHVEQLQRPCGNRTMGAYISDKWNITPPSGVPGNCNSFSLPVRGYYDGIKPVSGHYEQLIRDGFVLEWMRSVMGDQDCDECRRRGGECRFVQLSFQCFCPDGLLCSNSTSTHPSASTSATAGLFFTCLVWIMHRRKQRLGFNIRGKYAGNESNAEEVLKRYQSLTPKRYRYSDLKKITKCFKEKIGEGGFGTVFKGNLKDGRMVAVKLLKGTKGNGEEFLNEVTSIGRTSHVNIVNLLGFCLEGSKRALVYEYMANGSLGKYIYSEILKSAIALESLQKIAIGVARGLEYLHRGCSTRIIHFDIKPNNILLDEDFCPKIADFGLAKLCLLKDSVLSMAEARGTIGFIAPEVFSRGFGVVSTKSDVYSYGMMLLEMVEGRKNVKANTDNSSAYFPNWIYDDLVKDLQRNEVMCENEEIARKITLVGLWCIQTAPEIRPSMSKVIEMLEKNINELEMPPKPILSFQQIGLLNSSSRTNYVPGPMAPTCFFALYWLPLMLAAAARGAEEEGGGGCLGSQKCGDLNISSPFWITQGQADKPCGPLDFQLQRRRNSSKLCGQRGFDIINISYGDRTLLVFDVHRFARLNSSTDCSLPVFNTFAKLPLTFTISPSNLNLVFYNCTKAPPAEQQQQLGLVETRCGNNTFARLGGRFDGPSDYDKYYLEGCSSNSTVFSPMLVPPDGKANASSPMAPTCFFALYWLPLMLAAAARGAEEEGGGGCLGSQKCGDLNISSPFWITQGQADKPCGPLDFQLQRRRNSSKLCGQRGFDIINISYGDRTLLVFDVHRFARLNSSTDCSLPVFNTFAKLPLTFTISPSNLNLVFYNCTKAPPAEQQQQLGLVETRCGNNTFARLGGRFDGPSDYDKYYLEGCSSNSTVFSPMLVPPDGKANASRYVELVRGGFLITWGELPPPKEEAGAFPFSPSFISHVD